MTRLWRSRFPEKESVSARPRGLDLCEGHVLRVAAGMLLPLLEEATVAEGGDVSVVHVECREHAVDPFRWPFELGVLADGRLVDDTVAFAIGPFAAPLLVNECEGVAEHFEDGGDRLAVLHCSFGFDAFFVARLGRVVGRGLLVSQEPVVAVAAQAQDLTRGAELVRGRVEEDVALKGARRLAAKAELGKDCFKDLRVADAELDLYLNRLHARSLPQAREPQNGEMAETERLPLSELDLQNKTGVATIERVAAIWRGGGTVAFPTETVYGLGAHAFDPKAVERIFSAKQRPAWDPVIVHVGQGLPLGRLVASISDTARALMEAFWPGPLTLLLPRGPEVPDIVTAGRPLVGVRVPAHPVARALIAAAGMPIAAPSANSFGRPSPTTAAHVLDDLDGRIDAVVDSGPTRHGVESTVVDASQSPVIVYRPGAVTLEALRGVVGEVKLYNGNGRTISEEPSGLPSPGIGIRHYAPRATMVLVETQAAGDEEAVAGFRLFQAVARLKREGKDVRVGVMAPDEFKSDVRTADFVFGWGRWSDLDSMAQRLFSGLRWLDAQEATHIVCPLPPERGVGRALRDRLEKAAWLPVV